MSDDPFPGSPDDMMDRLLAQETKIERLEDALAAMRERTIDECEAIADEVWEETRIPEAAQIAHAISALRASLPPRAVKVDVSKEWCIAAAEQEGNLSIGAGAPPPPSDEDLPTADDVRGILGPPTPSRVCPDCGVPMTDHGDDPFREGVRRWHCQRCDGWRLDTPVAALALVRKGVSTAYEELVERCRKAYEDVLWGVFAGDPDAHEMQTTASNAFLSEVFRTLKNVTPEMLAEAGHHWGGDIWDAMLRASPLAPPKEGK